MPCRNKVEDATNKLAAAVGLNFPFPDAARANSPAGRRAVKQWRLDVVNSDAAIMQMRKDLALMGIQTTNAQNFTDAIMNVGNSIAAKQREESGNFIRPLAEAIKAISDRFGIRDMAERKDFALKIGKLREAYHAKERYDRMKDIRAPFLGANSEVAVTKANANAARKARLALLEDYEAGKITSNEFYDSLQTLLQDNPVDYSFVVHIGGMEQSVADEVIQKLEADPNIKAGYDAVKPYIDRVFDRVTEIHHHTGRITEESRRLIDLYGFTHYVPVYGASNASNLNEASMIEDINPDVLGIAESGAVTDRIPMFAALQIQLNGAAKNAAENFATQRLYSFAKQYGKDFGMAIGGGKEVYGMSDTGHTVATQRLPDNSVPWFNEGKLFWVTIDTASEANAQLFSSIRNRLTQNFAKQDNVVNRTVQKYMTTVPARLFTNLNYNFWFNSLVRDPLSVLASVSMDSRIRNKSRVLADVAKYMTGDFNHISAMRYYQRSAETRTSVQVNDVRGDLLANADLSGVNSTFAVWNERMARAGGETLFNRSFYSQDFVAPDGSESIDAAVPLDLGGSVRGLDGALEASKALGKGFMRHTGDLVSAFDAQARLSVFRSLVENGGYTDMEAAAIVREFMDFSAKANSPTVFSTMIPFFRTAVVAADRTIDMVFYNEKGEFAPKYTAMGAMVAAGFLMALGAKGDDDDDGVAHGDKISHGRFLSHVVLGYDDAGNARSVPLPYGPMSIFVAMGGAVERMKSGAHNPEDVLAAYTMHAAKNLLPVNLTYNSSGDAVDSLPSALANLNPILGQAASIFANKNAFGSPIHNDGTGANAGETAAIMGRTDTPQFYKDMAMFLHDNASVDMFPETIAELLSNWTPMGIGRGIESNLKRSTNRELGSVDPEDWKPVWESTVGAVFLDKSPTFYGYAQYKKASAVYADIKRRGELGMELTPEMIKYYQVIDHYKSVLGNINQQMDKASDEQRYELLLARRQVERITGLAGFNLDKENGWDTLASGE